MLVPIPDGKTRPAVVIRVREDGRLLIVYCTRTKRSSWGELIEVISGSHDAKQLGLTDTSYFYLRSTRTAQPKHCQNTTRFCPGLLLSKLTKFADRALQQMDAAGLLQALPDDPNRVAPPDEMNED